MDNASHPATTVPRLVPAGLLKTARRLGDFSSDAFVATDDTGAIVYSNEKATELFGWTDDQLMGEPISKLIPARYRSNHAEYVRSFAGGADSSRHLDPVELKAVSRSGREFPVSVAISRTSHKGAVMLIASIRDISAQVATAEALRANEERLNRIFEAAAVALWDEDFTKVGAWLDSLRAAGVEDIAAYLADRPSEIEYGASLIEINSFNQAGLVLDNAAHGEDGKDTIASDWFNDSVRAALIKQFEAIWKQEPQVEVDMIGSSNGEPRNLILYQNATQTNGEMDLSSVIISMVDITDRVEAERHLEMVESHLRQAQKLEAIGQLAAGVAHEINTPVQYVGDNARFLRESFGGMLDAVKKASVALEAAPAIEDVAAAQSAIAAADLDFLADEVPAAFEELLDGVARVATIVSALKKFSHPGTEDKTPEDLNDIITDSLAVCRNEWKYHATVETDLSDGLPRVPCMPTEIGQVIINLVVNAAHAVARSARDGVIRIGTEVHGDTVRIAVEDNGPGVPEGIRDRIFEPFFTTKDVGEGTGQGLALAYKAIVEQHNGSLVLEDAPGHGARFVITLPLLPD